MWNEVETQMWTSRVLLTALWIAASLSSEAQAPAVGVGDSEAYASVLVAAAVDATRVLASAGDPIFSDPKRAAVQLLPPVPLTVAVLFPTARSFPAFLKTTQQSPQSICQSVPHVLGDPPNLIVCNVEMLRTLDVLTRVSHEDRTSPLQANDWSLIQTLGRAATDPTGVVKECRAAVTDSHMRSHLTYVLAILLAHESWHLQHGMAKHFDAATTVSAAMRRRVLCRHYQEFGRSGITLGFENPPTPIEQEGTTEDPMLQGFFRDTRQTWIEELQADEYSAMVMAKMISYIKRAGSSAETLDHAVNEITQSFEHIMQLLWFGRLRPFAMKHCAGYAGQNFFLSKCLCNDRKLYDEAADLFSPTHPPIILRMFTGAVRFAGQVRADDGIDVTSNRNHDMMRALASIITLRALLDVPHKLAATGCALLAPKNYVSITMILPDRAGFIGPDSSDTYPGYPADEASFLMNCNNQARKPAPAGKRQRKAPR